MVPADYVMLTFGGDQQEGVSVYVVDAWKPDGSSHTVLYGTCENRDELIDLVLTRKFKVQGGGEMMIAYGLFDSGFRASKIYDFCIKCCQLGIPMLPCKGSNFSLNTFYKIGTLSEDTSHPGAPLVHVDTLTTQDWIESQLHDIKKGEPGAASLFSAALVQHQDFLEQLLNETSISKLDGNNYSKEVWNRITDDLPNDMRDSRRYSYTAFRIAMAGGIKGLPPGNTSAAVQRVPQPPKQKSETSSRGGGWEVSL